MLHTRSFAILASLLMALFLLPWAAKAQEAYVVSDGPTLTFYYDTQRSTRPGTVYSIDQKYEAEASVPAWAGIYMSENKATTKVVFDPSFKDFRPTSTHAWFNYCDSLNAIEGLENFNTSSVTDMSKMFAGCTGLTSIDLTGLDTSNVTNMNGMFFNCRALTSLDLSCLNTEKLTDMSDMFSQCEALTSINLSGLNTSNVTDMVGLFRYCSSLTSVDLSGLNTAKVENMAGMFGYCYALTSINLSGIDTSNVLNMYNMFGDCSALTSLDVSGFDTSNVFSMSYMFRGCISLTSLDVTGFDTSNVTEMCNMFFECIALTSLDLSHFDTSKLENVSCMFGGCHNLATIYCNDTWTCEYSEGMFAGCTSLRGAVPYDETKIGIEMANPDTGYFTRTGTGSVDAIEGDTSSKAPAEIFNLQGLLMSGDLSTLPAGVYLLRRGSSVTKIAIN